MKTLKGKPSQGRFTAEPPSAAGTRGNSRVLLRLQVAAGREHSWRVPLGRKARRAVPRPDPVSVELTRTVQMPREPAMRLSLVRAVAESALRREGAMWGR